MILEKNFFNACQARSHAFHFSYFQLDLDVSKKPTLNSNRRKIYFQGYNQNEKSEANLPSEASIGLPAVHVVAEYIPENATGSVKDNQRCPEGVVFRQGGYLNANADIGVFEHSLTTDLLNHLVFVQKVFMKVNDLIDRYTYVGFFFGYAIYFFIYIGSK